MRLTSPVRQDSVAVLQSRVRLVRLYQMNAAIAAKGKNSSIASKLPNPPSGEMPKIRSIKSIAASNEVLAGPRNTIWKGYARSRECQRQVSVLL